MSSLSEITNPPTRHSLRTELLIGQLAVLLLVVVGFGGAIYALVRQGIYREVEADLLGASQMIRQELVDGKPLTDDAISGTYWHRFGPAPRDQACFAVWNAQGLQIVGSDNLPAGAAPLDRLPPVDGPRPFTARSSSGVLEVFVRAANGGQILIGRPLGKESDRLRSLLWRVLAAIARDTLAWLAPLADDKQLRFTSQLHAATANCDAAQLGQVIVNLVTNAVEHSPIAGEIIVSTEVDDDRALLRIQDFGVGIAAAAQCRIFERFFRTNAARTLGECHGAGLGLSIVAEIVAGHGGTIEVTSEPGSGTQFTVSLPHATPSVKDYRSPP